MIVVRVLSLKNRKKETRAEETGEPSDSEEAVVDLSSLGAAEAISECPVLPNVLRGALPPSAGLSNGSTIHKTKCGDARLRRLPVNAYWRSSVIM